MTGDLWFKCEWWIVNRWRRLNFQFSILHSKSFPNCRAWRGARSWTSTRARGRRWSALSGRRNLPTPAAIRPWWWLVCTFFPPVCRQNRSSPPLFLPQHLLSADHLVGAKTIFVQQFRLIFGRRRVGQKCVVQALFFEEVACFSVLYNYFHVFFRY